MVMIFEWADEDADVFSAVLTEKAPFKIILKTKDDPWFIREWYEHHAAIVGPSNLIIFDNCSSDPEVLAFYDEVSAVTPIFRHPFGVNHIHNVQKCSALYDALRRTSKLCAVLDTDERLLMMETESRLAEPSNLVPLLLSRMTPEAAYAPTLWLGNAFRSKTDFKLTSEEDFANCLRWGKPVMVTERIPSAFVNHNCQLADLMGHEEKTVGLLLLHLTKLHPEQRIAGNLRKLEGYGFIEPGAGVEAALTCDTTKIKKGDPEYWVREIRSLLDSKDHPEQRAQVVIEADEVSYRTESARELLRMGML